jgi:hypothetical protein
MPRSSIIALTAAVALVWAGSPCAQSVQGYDEFSSGPSSTASGTQLCANQRQAAITEIENRYATQVIEPLDEQRNLATAEFNKASIDCQTNNGENDQACIEAAQKELQKKLAELDKKRIDASTAQQNEMQRVNVQPCPSSGNSNSLGQYPLPPADPNAPLGTPGNPLQGRVTNEPDTPPVGPGGAPGSAQMQPDAAQLQPLQTQLEQILKDAAAGGFAATDQFFSGMVQAVDDNIKFLSQEPGVPAQQMGKAIFDYLTNDNANNHEQLLKAAKQAAQDFQQNPAHFLGYQAGNAAFNEATGGLASAAGGATQQLTARARAIAQAEKAANRLIEMNEAANEANAAVRGMEAENIPPVGGSGPSGNVPAGQPPVNGAVTAGSPAMEEAFPVNPRCLQNNCVPAAIAHDLNIRNPENTLRDYDVLFKSADQPTSYKELTQLLEENYGGSAIADLTDPVRLQLQAEGIPTEMLPQQILDEIKNAPDGRGIVIYQRDVPVQDATGAWTTETETHAVHAQQVGTQVKIWDPQSEQGRMGAFLASRRSWLYRTN